MLYKRPMRRLALVAIALALVGAAVARAAFTDDTDSRSASSSARTSTSDACPAARRVGRLVPRGLNEAIRREVPRAYADLEAQGEPAWPGFVVVAVARLDRAYPTVSAPNLSRFVERHRATARRLCGGTVADRSWVVVLYFPNAPAALLGNGVAYFARTPDGWQLWHRRL